MRNLWIFSKPVDLLVLGLPVWLSWIACFLAPADWLDQALPLWIWVVFILGIDVSHVWSTIFRTYLDRNESAQHRRLLWLAPLVAFAIFFLVANLSVAWFWRILAYLALFHFIKQQYGFLMLYKMKHRHWIKKFFGDKWVIYFSMLYPVLYWHFASALKFNWFVEGDFFSGAGLTVNEPWFHTLTFIGNTIYWIILAGWVIEEIYRCKKAEVPISWGKLLWVLTTAGNWYLGIVYFNSDIAFSITNVVAHGVPYMALIFFYVERKKGLVDQSYRPAVKKVVLNVAVMLIIILSLAYGEEYFWNLFLFRDHDQAYAYIGHPVDVLSSTWGQALALALLSVPQTTHYILDGFIWKANAKNPFVKRIFSGSQ